MHLVQILLPLYDNAKNPFPKQEYARVRDELTERFGGLTEHVRSPARGIWVDDTQTPVRDDIVIFEVMDEQLDRTWWKAYREQLTGRFRQDELVIRASPVEPL